MSDSTGHRVAARLLALAGAGALALAAFRASAQGLPSATLTGHVTQAVQGLPGVTVTARSPNLQGSRSATTTLNGDYAFNNLPPGDYTVTFALASFQPVTKSVRLAASQKEETEASVSASARRFPIPPRSRKPARSACPPRRRRRSTGLQVDTLPTTRTLLSAVALSPGVNQNGPNAAFTISGAQSFDNQFSVNGAVINDNIRGDTVQPLHRGRDPGDDDLVGPRKSPRSSAGSRAAS